jgi:hypothetical protein
MTAEQKALLEKAIKQKNGIIQKQIQSVVIENLQNRGLNKSEALEKFGRAYNAIIMKNSATGKKENLTYL